MDKRDERKRTFEEAPRKWHMLSKPKYLGISGKSIAEICLLAMWQPLYRRHDFYPGLFAEHRKPHVNAKGKHQAVKCEAITEVT
jgi:hypothetical protein